MIKVQQVFPILFGPTFGVKYTLLLKTTSLPLDEIAIQIGYQNVENFIRIFKKAYQITPSNYRRKTT